MTLKYTNTILYLKILNIIYILAPTGLNDVSLVGPSFSAVDVSNDASFTFNVSTSIEKKYNNGMVNNLKVQHFTSHLNVIENNLNKFTWLQGSNRRYYILINLYIVFIITIIIGLIIIIIIVTNIGNMIN